MIEINWNVGKEWAMFTCPDGPSICFWEPYDDEEKIAIKSQLLAQVLGWA